MIYFQKYGTRYVNNSGNFYLNKNCNEVIVTPSFNSRNKWKLTQGNKVLRVDLYSIFINKQYLGTQK